MNEAKKPVKRKNKKSTELQWIVGTMILMLAILVMAPYIFKQVNTFSYENLTFTKEKFGEISVYHYYYSYLALNNRTNQYNLYIRIDPRENNVPVYGKIEYPSAGSAIYVSLSPAAFTECQNTLREMSSLAGFLNGNEYRVKAGSSDKEFAKANNITYVTCEEKPNSHVIMIVEGNETKIERKKKCYVISVDNCEMLSAVERFEVQSLIDARQRASLPAS